MAADPSPVLARVRKLLALATSPNLHEAAAAAAAAQTLIERHRLGALLHAESEADLAITDGREAPLARARRLRTWKLVLAATLAESNGCVAWTAAEGAETLLLLAGRADDREAIVALYDWLVTRIEWLSATEGAGRSRDWHEAFRIGAAEVIVQRLREGSGAERATMGEAALAVIEPALAARAAAVARFAETHLRLKPGRGLRVDARGLSSGRAAGEQAPLPPRPR